MGMKHLYSEKSMPIKVRFLLGILSLFTAAYFTQPWIGHISTFWWPLVFAAVWMPIMFVAMEIAWQQYHSTTETPVRTRTADQADTVVKADAPTDTHKEVDAVTTDTHEPVNTDKGKRSKNLAV